MDEIDALFDSFSKYIGDFFKEVRSGPNIQEQVLAFAHAVDWTEPWIILLLSFHIVVLTVVLATRRRETLQFTLFLLGVVAVWGAEYLNACAARHWESFSRQDYFDPSGLFVSAVFSGPVLVICIVILVQLMVTVVEMMFKWKRAELKHRARTARRTEETPPGCTKED